MKALSQAQIDAIAANGRELFRKRRAEVAKPPVNLRPVLELGQPTALEYRGVRYGVKLLSWRDGVQLSRAQVIIHEMAKNPPTTIEAFEDAEADLLEILALFHSFIVDAPADNPFNDATPQEVGALLGFFSACQMKQSAPSGFRPATTRPH